MIKITSKLFLNKKGIFKFMFLIFLCSWLISENVFSLQQWSRDYIQVKFDKKDRFIYMKVKFIQYEFGSFGENAYLEQLDINYSSEGLQYVPLVRCEVHDQVLYNNYSWFAISVKSVDAKIQVYGCYLLDPCTWWPYIKGIKSAIVKVQNNSKEASFILKWNIPANVTVKDIEVKGKWHVNGLNCDNIVDEKYTEDAVSDFDIPGNTASKPVKKDFSLIHQLENNKVMVYNETDAVMIKGADPGENIQVYNTTGTQIKATIANNDVVKIKLPANQIYFVHIGQSRYKVAL